MITQPVTTTRPIPGWSWDVRIIRVHPGRITVSMDGHMAKLHESERPVLPGTSPPGPEMRSRGRRARSIFLPRVQSCMVLFKRCTLPTCNGEEVSPGGTGYILRRTVGCTGVSQGLSRVSISMLYRGFGSAAGYLFRSGWSGCAYSPPNQRAPIIFSLHQYLFLYAG